MSKVLILAFLLALAMASILDAQILVLPFIFMINMDKNKLPCLREQGSKKK
ncbi:hypothetical protein ACTWQB_16400 [Piscibacillus sp. B03]|uniref:hypothetical protein n=1 Tax=Piscibacillus sp. B03 TaxID=3457430 RepID=UPI003FCD7A4F